SAWRRETVLSVSGRASLERPMSWGSFEGSSNFFPLSGPWRTVRMSTRECMSAEERGGRTARIGRSTRAPPRDHPRRLGAGRTGIGRRGPQAPSGSGASGQVGGAEGREIADVERPIAVEVAGRIPREVRGPEGGEIADTQDPVPVEIGRA